jgi:hypothetical protein
MPRTGYRSVGLVEDTYQRLVGYAGRLQEKRASRVSVSKAVDALLEQAHSDTQDEQSKEIPGES